MQDVSGFKVTQLVDSVPEVLSVLTSMFYISPTFVRSRIKGTIDLLSDQ